MFNSVTPTLALCRKAYGENGLYATQAIMSIIINDLVKSFNLGQTMSDEQVGDLINDIIDQYYFLNIEDFRLCFNNAKNGRYDKGIFRLDASVVLNWLNRYTNDRLNEADNQSYDKHQSTKTDVNLPNFEQVYKKFGR